MKITIVGAGISGLAAAYALGKLNHTIEIIAKEFTPNITAGRAAAFWFPITSAMMKGASDGANTATKCIKS
ncbi:MAG: FAD-dependent oxidoreductase [Ginsengibacter sp.]